MLPGGSGIELAAHFRESVFDVRSEVGQVFAHRVETGRGCLAKVPDLSANLCDVAVRSASEHPGGCRVPLAVPHTVGQFPNLGLQRGYARALPRRHAVNTVN